MRIKKEMSQTVIKVENLSKLYRLGEVGTGTISHDLNRWIARIRGKEDPFAVVGNINDRTRKASGDYAWALKDVNFEIKQGEVWGIIGNNGAGKSTLLKLLSQITSPTTGEIKIRGRIAALLEVGTGMHQEMTARENIYLNGAILGMRRKEIRSKFDEIVEFSGCAMYVDTPIKRFSSGMRVRLGFAVAAFLEPEILIVDEVLAVGDAEFQKKAIGKMQDVSQKGGRTVLFVSHNMGSILQLCEKGILMNNGQLAFQGTIRETVDQYISKNTTTAIYRRKEESNAANAFNAIYIKNKEGEPVYDCLFDQDIVIEWDIDVKEYEKGTVVGMQVLTSDYVSVFSSIHAIDGNDLKNKKYAVSAVIPSSFLNPGKYIFNTSLHVPNKIIYDKVHNELGFNVIDTGSLATLFSRGTGLVNVNLAWQSHSR